MNNLKYPESWEQAQKDKGFQHNLYTVEVVVKLMAERYEQRIAELEDILIGIDFLETKAKLQELEKLIQQAKELLK